MARRAAPPAITGGGGFGFEDKVVAHFLACILANEAPLGAEFGTLTRIEFQTRPLGWLLDDVMLVLREVDEHSVALSLKSNQQITRNSFPADFRQDVWEQYLRAESTVFDPNLDLLGLVTAPLPPQIDKQLQELVHWANEQDGPRLLTQVAHDHVGSAIKRRLLASMHCPSALAATYGIAHEDTGALLRRLRFLQFDFDHLPSKSEQQSIRLCRDLLRSGSLSEARLLWNELVILAHDVRPVAGYFDLRRLVTHLGSQFDLVQFPQFRRDWEQISNWTTENLRRIPDQIGNRVSLTRSEEVDKITQALSEHRAVAITGPSGCGKSVLGRLIAQDRQVRSPVIWFDAKSLITGTDVNLRLLLGLQHELRELAASTTKSEALCIIDNIGSIATTDGYRNISTLLDVIGIDNEYSAWRLLIICQQEEWERVQFHLFQSGIQIQHWGKVTVEPLTIQALEPVWKTFPVLAPLKFQRDLWPLLLRPKVLDLLASRVALGEIVDTNQWAGESSLIAWYWQLEMAKPPHAAARSNLLKELAERQADELRVEVESTQLRDVTTLDGLINDKVCNLRDEKVSFSHDLYADWARQRILLEKDNRLKEYLAPRLSSPLWNRAVRLYGLHLLEQHSDASIWKTAVEDLGTGLGVANSAQDLLLEAIIFATQPETLLERTWEYLAENEGLLLQRLLGRFLHVATDPNPLRLHLAQSSDHPGAELEAATVERIPYWPYWLPLLRFLHKYSEDVRRLAPEQVAKIANTWLRHTASGMPYRNIAAQLGLALAETSLKNEWNYRYPDSLTKVTYQAALACGAELPSETTDFVQRASGRKKRPPREVAPEHRPRLRLAQTPQPMGEIRQREYPWPDGPVQRAHDEFADICLTTSSIYPLIDELPNVAGEVLLALIIKVARASERGGIQPDEMYGDALELNDPHDYYPPFYYHFPWMYFLRTHPQIAIATILKLVNFATERWADKYTFAKSSAPTISLLIREDQLNWVGDVNVYYWYRDNVHTPRVLTSVLMALEKWLYDQLDKGENIDGFLGQIINGAQSVAFAGVLSGVGKRHKTLLQGPLQLLMTPPEFHWWERMYHLSDRERYSTAGWFSENEAAIQLALEWHNMPHRKESLNEVARSMFIVDQENSFFKEMRSRWQDRRNQAEDAGETETVDILERLISAFDPNDYTNEVDAEHNRIVITHEYPEHILERSKEPVEQSRRRILVQTLPMRCRELIDGEKSLSDDEAEQWWQTIEQILTFPEESFGSGYPYLRDCICGGAAALLIRNSDWLKHYPERFDWCREQILNHIEKDQNIGVDVGDRYIAHTVRGWAWDDFCAEAVPGLWCDDLSDPRVRECIVALSLSPRYEVVSILCKICFHHRSTLKGQFLKVQCLLRLWAIERKAIRIRQRSHEAEIYLPSIRSADEDCSETAGDESELNNESTLLLSASFMDAVEAFIEDSISTELPSLVVPVRELERTWRTERHRDHERPRQEYTLDIGVVQAMYDWIPSLDLASSDLERRQWIGYWRDILDCFLYTLRELPNDVGKEKEIDGVPFDEDRWLLGHLAELIFEMRMDEHPEEIYGPILGLGCMAHDWVTDFLRHFFIYHLKPQVAETSADKFVRLWSAMIDYSVVSPYWNWEPGKQRSHIGEIWQQLMGLDYIYSSSWDTEMIKIADMMFDYFDRWSQFRLKGSDSCKAFIHFLRRPAAVNIRCKAFLWLNNVVQEKDSVFFTEIGAALARLIALVWESQRGELRQNTQPYSAFISIVRWLSDNQNGIALEIQKRMASGHV